MSGQIYEWQRYWCPREGVFRITGDGYLFDPSTAWGRYYTDAVPFKSIEQTRCLILLGEPGIGKSSTLERERDEAEVRIRETGGVCLLGKSR